MKKLLLLFFAATIFWGLASTDIAYGAGAGACNNNNECRTQFGAGWVCCGGVQNPNCIVGQCYFPAATTPVAIYLPNPLCLGGGANGTPCVSDFPGFIAQVATFINGLVASLALIAIVYAGFLFLTSAGNESRLGNAKKALLWGIVGAAIALVGTGLVAVIRTALGA